MPNQLIALVTQLTAKRTSSVSIRHSPGFGIASQVMGRDPRNAGTSGVPLQKLPNNLFGQRGSLDLVAAVHRAEYRAGADGGG
jgi:hypothetical protein